MQSEHRADGPARVAIIDNLREFFQDLKGKGGTHTKANSAALAAVSAAVSSAHPAEAKGLKSAMARLLGVGTDRVNEGQQVRANMHAAQEEGGRAQFVAPTRNTRCDAIPEDAKAVLKEFVHDVCDHDNTGRKAVDVDGVPHQPLRRSLTWESMYNMLVGNAPYNAPHPCWDKLKLITGDKFKYSARALSELGDCPCIKRTKTMKCVCQRCFAFQETLATAHKAVPQWWQMAVQVPITHYCSSSCVDLLCILLYGRRRMLTYFVSFCMVVVVC